MNNISSLDWFPVVRCGDDLVAPRSAATWFGGDHDPDDNGQTASGVPTKGNPTLLGCALPLAGYGLKSLAGTPLPMMAFGLHHDGASNPSGAWVEVTYDARTLTLPVIDLGPSLRTRHGIDLTVAAFKHFAGNLSQGVIMVSYRLKRGALYLPVGAAVSAAQPTPQAAGTAASTTKGDSGGSDGAFGIGKLIASPTREGGVA
jgi:hypothetical protein